MRNARICTGNPAQPKASAVAVKNGRICAVGTDAETPVLKRAKTRIIDSRSRGPIPGISDAHSHVLTAAPC